MPNSHVGQPFQADKTAEIQAGKPDLRKHYPGFRPAEPAGQAWAAAFGGG
jgi:hypothetical protein